MSIVVIALLFVAIGTVECIPLILFARFERNQKQQYTAAHVLFNGAFITWSIYDLNFGYHYPHGPNSTFLIIPAWPAFALFYGLILPKMIRDRDRKYELVRISLALIYLAGCVFEGIMFTRI